jgi:CRP/FNR family transcriptional regulator, cyclic AMP receptor protein
MTMTAQQVADLLGESELFGTLDLHARLSLAERTSQRGYRRGQVVFVQDQPGDRMFVVADGTVRLLIHSAQGDAVELARHSRPAVFGELAVLDGGHRSATAEVITPAWLVGITRTELIQLMHSDERMVDAFLHLLGGLVRRANTLSSGLVFLDVRRRVAGKLLELVAWNADAKPIGPLTCQVPQSDVAQMVGGARQTVNHVLRQFEERGWIQLANRAFEVLDPLALHHLAEG